MSLSVVYSRAQIGLDSPLVTVEVNLHGGLPSTSIVGLPETVVKESKDRVKGSLPNLGFSYPDGRVTINLAPADIPKEGSRFDLPIAIGILAASKQIPSARLHDLEFLGELALSGNLRAVSAVLPAVIAAGNAGRSIIIPASNKAEASLSGNGAALPAESLLDVCNHLTEMEFLSPLTSRGKLEAVPAMLKMSDIRGHHRGKRALKIAAAGGHNLLLVGPPGTGKTMLASRFGNLLPEMTEAEALEVASIRSISRLGFTHSNWGARPFRSPHHTASPVAMVGGGNPPRPGEISLAHQGVLFLDELPEFGRKVLEVLREPLESGQIVISRAAHQISYPARFQLIAAMNPCPCGYHGDSSGRCSCPEDKVIRYRTRISGPLMDRIDLHALIPALPLAQLVTPRSDRADESEDSQSRSQVRSARAIMLARNGKANCDLTPREIDVHCILSREDMKLLTMAMDKFRLSARAWYRILKVSRTIADLDDSAGIESTHLAEALSFRVLDRAAIAGEMAESRED